MPTAFQDVSFLALLHRRKIWKYNNFFTEEKTSNAAAEKENFILVMWPDVRCVKPRCQDIVPFPRSKTCTKSDIIM